MEYNFNTICRLCLAEGSSLYIFKLHIDKKIMMCSSIKVKEHDGLPSKICKKCAAKLHASYQFKRQCENSDAKLKEYLNVLRLKKKKEKIGEQIDFKREGILNDSKDNDENLNSELLLETIKDEAIYKDNKKENLFIDTQIEQNNINSMNEIVGNSNIKKDFVAKIHKVSQIKVKKKRIRYKKRDKYICNICGKEYKNHYQLLLHARIHSQDSKFKCEYCEKLFSHHGNYKLHLRIHTGEKPHKCHLCERAFATSSNLITHVRTHTGEKPYVCTVCQKDFCQSNELTRHLRIHTGEKNYHCHVCEKNFNSSSSLTVHMRVHTGEKPYQCNECDKAFSQSSCLKRHLRKHTREENKKKKKNEQFKNPPCQFKQVKNNDNFQNKGILVLEQNVIEQTPQIQQQHFSYEKSNFGFKQECQRNEEFFIEKVHEIYNCNDNSKNNETVCLESTNKNLFSKNDINSYQNSYDLYYPKKNILFTNSANYKCSQCDYKFYLKEDMLHHIRISHSQNKF